MFAAPGVIVGRKGNPGVVTWAANDFFVIDTAFYVLPKSSMTSLQFLFHALKSMDLAFLSADSAVPGLNRNLAYMSEQVVPGLPVLKLFESTAGALTKAAHLYLEESQTIAALRDALLPTLISGELLASHSRTLSEAMQ